MNKKHIYIVNYSNIAAWKCAYSLFSSHQSCKISCWIFQTLMLDWLVQICKQKWIHFRIIWKIILKTCFQVKTHNLLTTISSPVQQPIDHITLKHPRKPQVPPRKQQPLNIATPESPARRRFWARRPKPSASSPWSPHPAAHGRSDAWWGFWRPSDGGWEKSTISNTGRYTSSTCFFSFRYVHVSFQGCSSESEKGGGWKMMFLFNRVTFSVPAVNFQGDILKGTQSTPIEKWIRWWLSQPSTSHPSEQILVNESTWVNINQIWNHLFSGSMFCIWVNWSFHQPRIRTTLLLVVLALHLGHSLAYFSSYESIIPHMILASWKRKMTQIYLDPVWFQDIQYRNCHVTWMHVPFE